MTGRKILFIPLLCLALAIRAQNTGYGGKRYILKCDVVEGIQNIFSGISAEILVHKRMSLSVGYKNFESVIPQRYDKGEYDIQTLGPVFNQTSVKYGSISRKAIIHTSSFDLEYRIYHFRRWRVPAPQGFFNYLTMRFGTMSVKSGYYYAGLLERNSDLQVAPTTLIKYEYKNINFYTVELGLGYQYLYHTWLLVGAKAGINFTELLPDNKGYTKDVLSGVDETYGGNATYFNGSFSLFPGSSNINLSGGLSFTLQVGAILF